MTATGLVDGQEEYLVLASDLDSWDGSVEGADALRARLLALPPQRVKPEGDVQRVTHLRRLADKLGFGGGKKGKPNGSVDPSTVVFTERWSTISDDRVLAWSGILMGAPERAGWPFDVHALPDDPPRKAKSKPDSVRSWIGPQA